jgi:hypothetical protein
MHSFDRLPHLGPNTIPTLRDLHHVPRDVKMDELASQKRLVSDFLDDLMTCHLLGAVMPVHHLRLAHPADAASHAEHLRRCVHDHIKTKCYRPHRAVPSIHDCREVKCHSAHGVQVLPDAWNWMAAWRNHLQRELARHFIASLVMS